MHLILSKQFITLFELNIQTIINTILTDKQVMMIFITFEIIISSFLLIFKNKKKNIYHSEKIKLTDKIEVPKPIGEGQHRNVVVA